MQCLALFLVEQTIQAAKVQSIVSPGKIVTLYRSFCGIHYVEAHPVVNASTQTKSEVALRLVTELHSLLLAHGERNWIRGVSHVGALLQDNDLASAASAYKGMLGGNGSFSDFYIHSDEFDARRRLNEPLDRLRDQIWIALGL